MTMMILERRCCMNNKHSARDKTEWLKTSCSLIRASREWSAHSDATSGKHFSAS